MSSAKKQAKNRKLYRNTQKLYRRINLSFSVMTISVTAVGLLLALASSALQIILGNRSEFISFSEQASENAFAAIKLAEINSESPLSYVLSGESLDFFNEHREISVSVSFGGEIKTNNELFNRTLAGAVYKKPLVPQPIGQKHRPLTFRYNRSMYYFISYVFTINGETGSISFYKNNQNSYMYVAIVSAAIGICFLTVLGSVIILGRFVAKKALSPLAGIAASVRNVTEANMAMPELPEKASSEVDMLLIELNAMLVRLESSFEEQRRFVSDVSHELRIPLTIIQGYIDIISGWGKDDASILLESLESMSDEISNMNSLVNKLLFLQNLGSGNIALNMEEFSVVELVTKVAGEAEMIGSGHSFNSAIRLKDVKIVADKVLLEQSMRSALDNAIKYSTPHGLITIGCEGDKGKAVIFISDTGPGIPKRHLEKVVQRFYRVDESRSKNSGGSGLGLSIIEASVKAIGGQFILDSTEGSGTVAKFVFPIHSRAHRSRSQEASA